MSSDTSQQLGYSRLPVVNSERTGICTTALETSLKIEFKF